MNFIRTVHRLNKTIYMGGERCIHGDTGGRGNNQKCIQGLIPACCQAYPRLVCKRGGLIESTCSKQKKECFFG